MPTTKTRKPRTAGNGARAQIKTGTCNSTLFREIVSIAIVGVLLAVLFVDSVVGMSGQFGPTPEVGFALAEVLL